jgi:hypothetical protein
MAKALKGVPATGDGLARASNRITQTMRRSFPSICNCPDIHMGAGTNSWRGADCLPEMAAKYHTGLNRVGDAGVCELGPRCDHAARAVFVSSEGNANYIAS